MNKIKKLITITLLSLSVVPTLGMGLETDSHEVTMITQRIVEEFPHPLCSFPEEEIVSMARILDAPTEVQKAAPVPEGVKYTNDNAIAYSYPNVLGEELFTFEKDAEIEFYRIMANGWYKVIIDGRNGYVDGNILRDTKEIPKPPAPAKKSVSKSAKASPGQTITFKLSFYTDIPGENGGYSTTASGKKPQYGMVASNVYPIGTRIYLEGYGEMVVEDRGGKHFNSSDRLDIFIPRQAGESNQAYKARVMQLGRKTTTGYIIK